LDETAIPALNASWRERETQLIDYCIRNLPSSGIFVDDDLASWAMTTPYGGINALHTEPNHRQKGYGVLAVKALAKYQAETLDFLPCSRVVVDNVASEKVMLKAGCHYSHNLYWFFYTEKYENETSNRIE
jgi:RimJ/RimL family protein N-acetyltransferase